MSDVIPVLVNAGSGASHSSDLADRLTKLFADAGMQARVELATTGADFEAKLSAAIATHPRLLVAGGGDGTISTAAATLLDSPITLGVLPLGTLNHFAKDLGIPLVLEGAIDVIARGAEKLVDVGEVNGRTFINNSSIGLYADMVRDRERQQRRLGRSKWSALTWAALATLRRYPFLTVDLRIDGAKRLFRTPLVFVGNNEYRMEGFTVGARTRLDAGELCIYIVKKAGRAALLRLPLLALFGRVRQARDFESMVTTGFQIETRHSHLLVATDGEITRMKTPLRYALRAHALRVMAPRARAVRE